MAYCDLVITTMTLVVADEEMDRHGFVLSSL